MGKKQSGPSKRIRRTFTEDFKRDAVNLVVVEGYSFQRAADAVGVSSRSVREWHEKFAPPPEASSDDPIVQQLQAENKRLRKASIWTYYKGARRCDDPEQMTTTILHTNDRKAWFWYIPLADDIVSIGVVGNNDYLLKGRGTPQET